MCFHLSEKWESLKSRDVMSNLILLSGDIFNKLTCFAISEWFGDNSYDGFCFVYTILHLNSFARTIQGSNIMLGPPLVIATPVLAKQNTLYNCNICLAFGNLFYIYAASTLQNKSYCHGCESQPSFNAGPAVTWDDDAQPSC